MNVLFGCVKFYSEKGFGFISHDSPNDLFFHMKNLSKPVATEHGVRFERIHSTSVVYPQPGNDVAFEMVMGERGLVANPWCFAKDYTKALEASQNWPKPARYRVVVTYDQIHMGGRIDEPHVEWGGEKGGTLEDLCDKYPRNRHDQLQYFGHSDFNRTSQIQKLVDGKWISSMEDPRPIVSDNYRKRRW